MSDRSHRHSASEQEERAFAESLDAGFDRLIGHYMDKKTIRGRLVLVSQSGRLQYQKAFGVCTKFEFKI